uniref:Uncharacterized protein n=2 Tax=Aegilops tauschii subsp. strangulata TaxID=200361 RepID=A0A453NEG9_AEGTS
SPQPWPRHCSKAQIISGFLPYILQFYPGADRGAMLRLGLHPCPHFSPPQPHPTLPRRLAASPLPRPPFPSAFTALQARNPPLQAAVSGAASGEERRGVDEGEEGADLHEALTKTRRLVECAMFASVAGLAYFLSNSLAIENYFSCFFPLPIVISSLRWGLEAGRKTMVKSDQMVHLAYIALMHFYLWHCLIRWLLFYCSSHCLALSKH